MATWNRQISIDGDNLACTKSAGNADPPPAPNHGARDDTADKIKVYESDRGTAGATINYHAAGLALTGIAMKNGGSVPADLKVEVRGNGNLLVLTDKGAEGTIYNYFVEGDGKQTDDPQIHNVGT